MSCTVYMILFRIITNPLNPLFSIILTTMLQANKGCGTTKSGKGGCDCTTPSGKSGKSGCGKSGKSGSHSMPYTSKATRLFHKANKMSLSMP